MSPRQAYRRLGKRATQSNIEDWDAADWAAGVAFWALISLCFLPFNGIFFFVVSREDRHLLEDILLALVAVPAWVSWFWFALWFAYALKAGGLVLESASGHQYENTPRTWLASIGCLMTVAGLWILPLGAVMAGVSVMR